MADVLWYYAKNDQQLGPISGVELRRLAQAGDLTRDDLVWREGMENWAAAGRVKGLFPDLQETIVAPGDSGASVSPGPLTPMNLDSLTARAGNGLPPAPPKRSLRRTLLWMQAILWAICVAVVLAGALLFVLAIRRAGSDSQQVAAAAAIYATFFAGAYVIARVGEKVASLILELVQRERP